jgi:anti-sigma regulatory factor (Ser/Thr protein kinase)
MMKSGQYLHLSAGLDILPEVIAFMEAIAHEQALSQAVCLKMQLAAEEVIAALTPGAGVEIAFAEKADRITLRLTCHPRGMDLCAFNLAWRPDLETGTAGLGLALASRYVDSFSLQSDDGGRLHLLFSVNKVFDRTLAAPEAIAPWRFYRMIKPTPENILTTGQRLYHQAAAAGSNPRDFHPDRLAALVAAEQLFGTLAETETGEIVGACFCIPAGTRMLDGFGPFVFSPTERQRMARDLACHTLERVARKPYSGVLTTHFDNDCFPAEFFIPAGRRGDMPSDSHDRSRRAPAWHFPLSDDTGGALYYHSAVGTFIREAMDLQDLPRTLLDIAAQAAVPSRHPSVFSTTLDRGAGTAALRLLMGGADLEANADAHLAYFAQEGIALCQAFLDLARPADAALIPVLLQRQFVPCLLLPGGGDGDLLVLERPIQRAKGAV